MQVLTNPILISFVEFYRQTIWAQDFIIIQTFNGNFQLFHCDGAPQCLHILNSNLRGDNPSAFFSSIPGVSGIFRGEETFVELKERLLDIIQSHYFFVINPNPINLLSTLFLFQHIEKELRSFVPKLHPVSSSPDHGPSDLSLLVIPKIIPS